MGRVALCTLAATGGLLLLAQGAYAQQVMTKDNGAAVGDNQNSQTAGPNGPTLLQDVQLVQKLQRFDRERIPERVVHATGTGAHGSFVATDDLSDLTKAKLFSRNTVTPVFVRFSTVIPSRSGTETVRDPRGFATKFYTQEGNWDLVGNNLPIFFIRDAMKFPDMIHALKPDPVTNVQEPERVFDFFSHIPESTQMLTRVYSNYGTPASYRQMNGSSVHALKLVNARGDYVYAKFAWKSQQGERNLRPQEIPLVQGKTTSHLTTDLYDAIKAGKFPKWDLTVQVLRPQDLNKFDFDPLDATKIWPGIPERKVGTMTLGRVPDNFFESTEQVAMAPGNLIPGIEASEDRMLQGRLFSYIDTQHHRLGANFQSLPINRPLVPVLNNNQDGAANISGRKGSVNYQPSRLEGALVEDPQARSSQLPLTGTTQQQRIAKTLNFRQAGDFYRALGAQDRDDLIVNLSGDLKRVKNQDTLNTMLSYFWKADADYGKRLAKAVGVDGERIARLAAALQE
ncbi:catalase [Massilia forsythiae]|uniref:Catalase n=2 Tax=Massilia forsythiae TaxID=2728020 RepID=A0A7Z2W1I1_9BURK|nr:catalase [Massilia forsythiae]